MRTSIEVSRDAMKAEEEGDYRMASSLWVEASEIEPSASIRRSWARQAELALAKAAKPATSDCDREGRPFILPCNGSHIQDVNHINEEISPMPMQLKKRLRSTRDRIVHAANDVFKEYHEREGAVPDGTIKKLVATRDKLIDAANLLAEAMES